MPRFFLHTLLALLLACAACTPSVQEVVLPDQDRVIVAGEAPGAEAPVQGLVRIVQVYGRETLKVGEAENFRLRLSPGFAQPVEYLWDFGDGTLSVGNNVVHRYTRPGRYTVTVVARNMINADTARLAVAVPSGWSSLLPTTPSVPVATPSSFEAGQIVWVTGIHATGPVAERDAATYTGAGYRAGVVSVSKTGATQYYVIVGGYRTEREAIGDRANLLRVDDRPLWLMRLTAGEESEGARMP